MDLFQRLARGATIDSVIWALPETPGGPLARNKVRIRKLLTLYLLDETYTLSEDGVTVAVHAKERFGPIPFLLRNEKRHGAVIGPDGMSSRYEMPLLGANWVAEYVVAKSGQEIRGHLRSDWGEAHELMRKQ
jgi:hypothetical protein